MKVKALLGGLSAVVGLVLIAPADALAHCDSLDGPVVKAAQKALDARRLADVLIWIQPDDESEIRAAFERTLAVRALGPEARELADRYFFETVVRVHRAGEGAPYTGLKPAGRDLGPAIPAADKALDERSLAPVVMLLTRAMETRLQAHFEHVVSARNFEPADVRAGRDYVKAYVEFIHYVERLYEVITSSPHGHFDEAAFSKGRTGSTGLGRR